MLLFVSRAWHARRVCAAYVVCLVARYHHPNTATFQFVTPADVLSGRRSSMEVRVEGAGDGLSRRADRQVHGLNGDVRPR